MCIYIEMKRDICIYIYAYIYIERERETETETIGVQICFRHPGIVALCSEIPAADFLKSLCPARNCATCEARLRRPWNSKVPPVTHL